MNVRSILCESVGVEMTMRPPSFAAGPYQATATRQRSQSGSAGISGHASGSNQFTDFLDEGLRALPVAALVVDDLADELCLYLARARRTIAHFRGELPALEC